MADAQSKLELVVEIQAKQIEVLSQIAAAITSIDKKISDANQNLGDVVENTNGRLTKSLNAIKGGVDFVAGAFLGWRGISGVVDFVKSSIDRFAESETSLVKLDAAVRIAGGDIEAMRPKINATTEDLKKFGFTGPEIAKGIADLVNRGFSVKQALDGISAAAKLAVLEGIPLEGAIHAIALASQGFIRPGSILGQLLGNLRDELARGGNQAENFQKVIERLAHLDPAAQAQLDTLATKTRQAKASWEEFSVNFGKWEEGWLGIGKAIQGVTLWLQKHNDEIERTNRLATGTAPLSERLNQEIKAKNDEAYLIGKVLERRRAELAGDQATARSPRLQFDYAQMEQLEKATGFADSDLIDIITGSTDKSLDNMVAGLEAQYSLAARASVALQKKLTTEVANERLAAEQAVDDQSTNQCLADLDHRQTAMAALLDKGNAEEIRQRVAMDAQQFAATQAEDEVGYRQKLESLKKNLGAQIAAIEQHRRDVLASEQQNAEQLTTLLQKSSSATVSELQRIFQAGGAEVPAEQFQFFALAGTFKDLIEEVQKFNADFVIDPKSKDFELAQKQFQALQKDMRDLATLKDRVAKIGIKVEISTTADIKTATDRFISEAKTEASRQLQDVKVLAGSGSITQQDAVMREMNIRLTEQGLLQTQLNQITTAALTQGRALTDDETKSVKLLNEEIAALRPTLQEVAATSDNWLVGMQLGLKEFQDKAGSVAQEVAGFFDRTLNTAVNKTSDAIFGLITGSKKWSDAFREMAASIVKDLIEIQIKMMLVGTLQSIGILPKGPGGAQTNPLGLFSGLLGGGSAGASPSPAGAGPLGFLGKLFGGGSATTPSGAGPVESISTAAGAAMPVSIVDTQPNVQGITAPALELAQPAESISGLGSGALATPAAAASALPAAASSSGVPVSIANAGPLAGLFGTLTSSLGGLFTSLFSGLSSLIGGIGSGVGSAASGIGGLFSGIGMLFLAGGGIIKDGSGPTADDVPIMASKGEAIIPEASVRKVGPSFIQRLIDGTMEVAHFAAGGFVSPELALAGIATPITSPNFGGQPPINLRPVINVTAVHNFGDDECERIGATTGMQKAMARHTDKNAHRIARHTKRAGGHRQE
jgi:lambda family phage tail tape measure protein